MANNALTFSQFAACTSVKSTDLILISSANLSTNVVTYVTKKANTEALFSNVQNLTISHNVTPANNADLNGKSRGTIWSDSSYIYVVVSNTEIKRVALSAF